MFLHKTSLLLNTFNLFTHNRIKNLPLKSLFLNTLLLLAFVLPAQIIVPGKWELVKQKEEVKIYTRSVPNSDIKEMQMTCTVSGASLSSFVALFQDLEGYKNWVFSCEKAYLLKRISENEIIYYINSDFPWPFEDRDFVLRNKIWQDENTKAFHSKSVAHNNFYATKKGIIRVKVFEAEWIITPLTNNQYYLRYTFRSDPAGSIPTWLINSFMDVGPLKTIKDMEKQAKSDKYSTLKYSFIEEL